MKDMKVRLSSLWVFVIFNMIFADIVGFLNPGVLEEMIAMKPAQGLLLVFSILLEIPIAMIVLSRLLKHSINRWTNIIASLIYSLGCWRWKHKRLLHLFRGDRSCVYGSNYLVCMEVD